jgi:hypothetical protein
VSAGWVSFGPEVRKILNGRIKWMGVGINKQAGCPVAVMVSGCDTEEMQ